MRSDPADYELLAPATLSEVVALLAKESGEWTPIAGGTDLMVLHAAGALAARKLVSLWNLPELRRIDMTVDEVAIGAACTYTDLRNHEIIAQEFPLLAKAASWTGGIANQNRGTLGGNIVNASPAADSLPALLVHEAELILVSARGDRRVKYVDFHTGYKKSLLAPDELVRAICLSRRFSKYTSYSRKVGPRNAQAISKVCLAALGLIRQRVVEDVRIAAGSVAAVPLRLRQTERFVIGKAIDSALTKQAREIAMIEIQPIDDVRSTAAYRSAVLGNLVVEFLQTLHPDNQRMNETLARWNRLSREQAVAEISHCCGSSVWANEMTNRRPFEEQFALIAASDEIWSYLSADDWLEAFLKHPRIGDREPPEGLSRQSASWSATEQQGVDTAKESVKSALAAANREYEKKFGRIFIVCATGKSASEMLSMLRHRMRNDESTELRESAEEQRKITNLRLRKWLER
jgi:OHCU decarboxylase